MVKDLKGLMDATREIGYPLVLKGCSSDIAHMTKKGLIKLDLRNKEEAVSAFEEICARMGTGTSVLVQEMVKGHRAYP